MTDLECPVCRFVYVRPRIYKCGHSACEFCHIKSDEHTEQRFMSSAIVYRCPVCRYETLSPWHCRPRNHALEHCCEAHPDYQMRLDEVGDTPAVTDYVYKETIDLAKVADQEHMRLTIETYEELLPVLADAVKDGRTYVTIDSKAVVSRIQKIGPALSALLFDRNNLFRMNVTAHDVTFYFLKSAMRTRLDFMNANFDDPIEESLGLSSAAEAE